MPGRVPSVRRGVMALIVAFLLAVPTVASAANGPARFYRATSGFFSVPLHTSGLTVYATSPAYLVLRYTRTTVAWLERYAASNTFPTVAVLNGSGTECFSAVKLVILPFFISDFTEGPLEYHGLFMTYGGHFHLNSRRLDGCRLTRAPGPVLPTVSLTRTSAVLSVTCLTRYCDGRFAAFTPASRCRGPVRLLPGVSGCSPAYNGFFKVPGGLTDRLTIPLQGTTPSGLHLVLVIGGRRVLSSTIAALARTPGAPTRPRTSSVSIGCTGVTAGVASTAAASGSIAPRGAGGVVVTFTGPSGTNPVTVPVGADGRGRWRAGFTPSVAGAWRARAAFIGDRSRTAAVSTICHFTVALQRTTVTVACPVSGGPPSASVSGTLSAPGLAVTVQYTPPTSSNTPASAHTVTASPAGAFSDAVTVGPNDAGQWTVKASFAGDSRHAPASATCTFAVP